MNEQEMAFEFGARLWNGSHVGVWTGAALLAAAGALAAWFWWPRLRAVAPGRRAVLTTLRVLGLLVLLCMLLDPTIVKRERKPGEEYVVVLFDDSRSMRIAGQDGVSRGERMRKAYEAARAQFEDKLRATHQLAFYRFGESISRIDGVRELGFDQRESDQTGAIGQAIRDLAGATVSGVVLFSDGVRQGPAADAAVDAATPVFTVGVDTDAPWRDLELKSVSVKRTNFDQSPVSITAHVSAVGLMGRQAVVEALEGTRVAASKPLTISSDPEDTRMQLEFVPQSKGWLACEARVRLLDAQPGERTGNAGQQTAFEPERVTENNTRGFLVDNRDRTYRILYLCGRPNWQNKFVRRALEADDEMQLVSQVRISRPGSLLERLKFRGGDGSMANQLFEGFDESEVHAPHWDESVFLRVDRRGSQMGGDGYPQLPEDLFAYDLVVWGDIEADFFSLKQMELTRDFVAKRGGSFLMLGGPNAFAEGRYADTLVEGMLPVMIASSSKGGGQGLDELYRAKPTVEGMLSGVWSLDPDPQRNDLLWSGMPQLYGLNRFALLRAGATEQARVAEDGGDLDAPVLFALQPYGLGRCAVLATGETWQWQMRAEDVKDESHERFWRQLVRSLVDDVPAPVVLKAGGDEPTEGKASRLDFLVRDKVFDKREGLNASLQVTLPGGKPEDLPSEESIVEAGVYSCEFTPTRTGLHVFNLAALNDKDEAVGSLEQAVYVQPDLREYRNATYDGGFLKDLATRSGGEFFGLDRLAELAERIPRIEHHGESLEVFPLWRFPAFYAALVVLFSLEWYLRRRSGQP